MAVQSTESLRDILDKFDAKIGSPRLEPNNNSGRKWWVYHKKGS
jgi:hypothetical protein